MTAQLLALPTPKRRPSSEIALKTWLEQIRASGERRFHEDDPVYAYCERVGIPEEWLHLCWREFKAQHTVGDRASARQRDWRATFRNCVRRNWYRIWWMNHEGEMVLTSAGRTLMREHEAK